MTEERKDLRRKILGLREALDPLLREEKSRSIHEKLLTMDAVRRAALIMVYVNFRSEVATFPLFAMLRQRKIAVCAPLTMVAERRLVPYQISDPLRDLQPGYCGIPEPDPARLHPVDPAEIDVVLVPGSVFDGRGGRLGYGGGYYDRFLAAEACRATRIGLAFEAQVVEALPLLPHDQHLHYLVTEKEIRKTAE
ncbi:MAG: 5-formyltetrahydrofolate cyclo-ligase [Desulfobulbaceae bacterium DB1]|nr:MAG: 5-formyltetrahydrofolate cyclo-ligase [Desulfobulbaceae bacterium DB1]